MAEKKFLDFMDRFDGGGARATGDKFEGGGLLSMLGNIFATPRGSEDRAKQEALAGLLGQTRPPMGQTSAAPQPQAQVQPQAQPQMDPFGGAGPNITGAAAERGMGLNPFGGADVPFNPAGNAPVQMQGSGMTPANNYAPSGTGPESPLSFEGFTRHIMENYDQGFVRRMLTSPDQYEPAYDLYVRNGGKL